MEHKIINCLNCWQNHLKEYSQWRKQTTPGILPELWQPKRLLEWQTKRENPMLSLPKLRISPIPVTKHLFSVDMVNSTDGWAVGSDVCIIRWDGAKWSIVTSPT